MTQIQDSKLNSSGCCRMALHLSFSALGLSIGFFRALFSQICELIAVAKFVYV